MLGPKDPEGYYVVLLRKECADKIRLYGDDRLEEIGDVLAYKTKSRRRALIVLRMKSCLASP